MTLPVTTVTVTQASLSGAVGSVITVTVTATGSRRRRPPESRHVTVARAGGHCDRHGAGRGWQPTAHGHGHGGTVALMIT